MRHIIKTYLGAASLLIAFTANAWALPSYPVDMNDLVQVTNIDTSTQYEGTYQITDLTNGKKFASFCLELNEPIFDPPATFKVQGIDPYAAKGGLGGATGGQDPISGATKWLFSNFVRNNILGATGAAENDNDLQLAFLKLEDELNATDSLTYLNAYNASITAQTYVTMALANNTIGNAYDVLVVNLLNSDGDPRQSYLVAPVPEPGTMVLLGAGFLGLAILGKRRMTKNV